MDRKKAFLLNSLSAISCLAICSCGGKGGEASVNTPSPEYAVYGFVTYPDRATALPNVVVTISGDNFSKYDKTDARGAYQISNVPSGTYQIQANAPGPYSYCSSSINVGQNDKRFDIVLGTKSLPSIEMYDDHIRPFYLLRFGLQDLHIGTYASEISGMILIGFSLADRDSSHFHSVSVYQIPNSAQWSSTSAGALSPSYFKSNLTPIYSEIIWQYSFAGWSPSLPVASALSCTNGFAIVLDTLVEASYLEGDFSISVNYAFE